ncbi:MAG: hypothetical protein R3B13_16555 [Polyangiaceae bacterium]
MIPKNEAQALFRRAKGRHQQRIDAAIKQVERWVWCKGTWHEHTLTCFARYQFLQQPTFMKAEPKKKGHGINAYGFDAQDRLVYEKYYFDPRSFSHVAIRHVAGGLESTRYRNDGALLDAWVVRTGRHGVTEIRIRDWQDADSHWKVRYQAGRPQIATVEHTVPDQPRSKYTLTAEWDANGTLCRLLRHDLRWDRDSIAWERPAKRKAPPRKRR